MQLEQSCQVLIKQLREYLCSRDVCESQKLFYYKEEASTVTESMSGRGSEVCFVLTNRLSVQRSLVFPHLVH